MSRGCQPPDLACDAIPPRQGREGCSSIHIAFIMFHARTFQEYGSWCRKPGGYSGSGESRTRRESLAYPPGRNTEIDEDPGALPPAYFSRPSGTMIRAKDPGVGTPG